MAERKKEFYTDAQGRMQERETFDQGQGKYKNLSTDAEANAGTKKLFTKDTPAEEKQEDQSLGGAAARARKKRMAEKSAQDGAVALASR
jgi:hypothetical protein